MSLYLEETVEGRKKYGFVKDDVIRIVSRHLNYGSCRTADGSKADKAIFQVNLYMGLIFQDVQ